MGFHANFPVWVSIDRYCYSMQYLRAICIASKINVNDIGTVQEERSSDYCSVSKDLDDGEFFWIVREKWCNIPACEPESKYLYVSQKRSDDIRCAREIGNGCFFVALKRARMPGWLQGKKQVWSAPGSLMMKVHRFDIAHPWNRHNWRYIPFPDTPIHIYIYIYCIYIYIYYNFIEFLMPWHLRNTHMFPPLMPIITLIQSGPCLPRQFPKSFLPRLRGKARFRCFLV